MSGVSKNANRDKFGSIEVGRGVAALLVVLHHTGSIMSEPRFFGAEPFNSHFNNFNVGVDFFFVLSGFIITWIHWDDIGRKEQIRTFAAKRFVRIYPPYWFILAPLVILYLIFTGAGQPSQRDPINIILSILLLPNPVQPVLGVAWTLTHEIFFYALFAVIIWCGRRALWILPAWALAIVAANLLVTFQAIEPLPFPLSFVFSPFNIEFIMGVGVAMILRHAKIPAPYAFASLGVLSFFILTWFFVTIQDDPLIGRLAFGTASILFVLGAVEIERQRPLNVPGFLLAFGASSYAVYLVHPVVLSFSINLSSRLGMSTYFSLNIIALVMAFIAAAFGISYHYLVERRLIRVARRIVEPRRKIQVPDRHPAENDQTAGIRPEQKASRIEA
ncbi:acyltransferase [Rhizobium sp. BK379]|jgi:exopolysaccharide production protein ExoZ|uniref:acyltransferase family protein n=1 Tax=Rhizobium sp. BK379 TaxID=2587059 RepID=UPI000380EA9D|nr:acyltransferase [Rhizobium sp. BK379]MBB3444207.1 peptidoglycan/LPS O-acetylase OafA/YrhL [Rhizobium sp. BK379]